MGKRTGKAFNRRQKKQLAMLMMIIIAAGIAAILLMTPIFNVRDISVKGNSVLKTNEIIKSSGIVKNVNIFSVSLGNAKQNVERMGYVEEAKLRRRLPGTIEISVVEAVGVAYLPINGEYVIISADGRGIERAENIPIREVSIVQSEDSDSDEENTAKSKKIKVFSADLPVIKGLENVKCKIGKVFSTENKDKDKKLLELLKTFSKKGYIFDIDEIDISSTEKIHFRYNNGKLNVFVGNIEKLEYKMDCFGPMLAEIGEDPKGFMDLERLTYREKE